MPPVFSIHNRLGRATRGASQTFGHPIVNAVGNVWTAVGLIAAALTALIGGVTEMPTAWKVLFVAFTFFALLSLLTIAVRFLRAKPHVRATVNQVRGELLSISETIQAIADLPVELAGSRLPLPAHMWGPPNQDILSRELPTDLYDETRSIYETAHQINSDVWVRLQEDARAQKVSTTTVRDLQRERIRSLLDAIPTAESKLRALALDLEGR